MKTPILIIGAGPAGCAVSYELSKHKLPHLIIDKATFPRDKICGDGLSSRVFFVLRKLKPELISKMVAQPGKFFEINSGIGVAPNGAIADLPIINPFEDNFPPAFSAKRLDFDNFLVENLDKNFANLLQNIEVKSIEKIDNRFIVKALSNNEVFEIETELIIGADGDRSIVKKTFLPSALDSNHYLAGVRAYYNGVTNMKNSLEFFMLDSVLPGYFWIFPLANGQANVGVCMLSNYVGKHKINLRETLLNAIKNEPILKERFANATLDSKILGWGLPVGSKPNNKISGDGFMLIGDAASVIDPFSGEGIAPAFYTGMYAAQAVLAAKNDYSAANLFRLYDKRVKRTMGFEFRFMRWFQNIYHYPRLINFLIKIFARNQFLIENAGVLFDPKARKNLRNPLFVWKLLKGFWA